MGPRKIDTELILNNLASITDVTASLQLGELGPVEAAEIIEEFICEIAEEFWNVANQGQADQRFKWVANEEASNE